MLAVGVGQQRHMAGRMGRRGQMHGQGGFPGPAFAGDDGECLQRLVPERNARRASQQEPCPDGDTLKDAMARRFTDTGSACLHAHNAAHGCFVARIDRA
jgi:hypothetical protein